MIRAFFGFPVDPVLGTGLAGVVDALKLILGRKAHWVLRRNYHMTLAFLGNVEEHDWPVLFRLARDVAAVTPLLMLDICRIGWFPSIRQPRVIAALARCGSDLAGFAERLRSELTTAGFRHESHRLRPHITLTRLAAPPVVTPAWPVLQPYSAITAVTLYRCDCVAGAVHYNPLFECGFDAGARKF